MMNMEVFPLSTGPVSIPSRLKQNLAAGKVTIGSWICIDSPMVAEVLAGVGFEWIVIDQEHTAIDIACAKMQMIAIQSRGVEVLVRVPALDEAAIKRALDCGAQGVVVPMINSASDAKTAVEWSYYPPRGRRGVGLHRAQGYGPGFISYLKRLTEGLVVIAQIEHVDAVRRIDQILDVDGIDGIIIGPYDLSASIGHPGDFKHPEMIELLEQVSAACHRRKKPYGYHSVTSNPSEAISRVKEGATFIAYGVDFLFLLESARNGLQCIREMRA
jgi:2-dehydro-3-deoxyglucarate aldolase